MALRKPKAPFSAQGLIFFQKKIIFILPGRKKKKQIYFKSLKR